jgi:hypothetical protein
MAQSVRNLVGLLVRASGKRIIIACLPAVSNGARRPHVRLPPLPVDGSGLDVAVHLVFGAERLLIGRLWCALRPHRPP